KRRTGPHDRAHRHHRRGRTPEKAQRIPSQALEGWRTARNESTRREEEAGTAKEEEMTSIWVVRPQCRLRAGTTTEKTSATRTVPPLMTFRFNQILRYPS